MLAKIVAFVRQLRVADRLLLLTVVLLFAFTAVASLGRLRHSVTAPVYVALFLPLIALSLRRLRLDGWTIAIVLSGLGLYVAYLGYTDFGERNYDGPEQLAYIEYIVKKRALPPAAHCLICHHPPAYYAIGAVVYSFFKATRLASPVLGLQLFSLAISLVFLVTGILTIRRLTEDRRAVHVGAALLAFWPYSVHNCVRLHNDTLVCAWMALALYFIVAWQQDSRPRDLYLAGLFSALGVMTKSSSYILVAVLLLLIGARLLASEGRLRLLKRAGVVALMLAAALSVNALARRGEPPVQGGLCERVLGSACKVSRASFMDNEPYNYVYLDVQGFLKEPYILTDRDDTGRQLFWNHLLKSSLFGTHNKVADPETAYGFNRRIAGVMSALLLGMTAYVVLAGLSLTRQSARKHAVPLITLAASLGFMMAFRMAVPAPHHTDFRHIFHALIPMALFYAAAVGHFRRRDLGLEYVGYALVIPFVLLSIVYFAPKYNLVMRLTAEVVSRPLSAYATVVPEGTPWDRDGNLRIEGNQIIEFAARGRTVSEIDVSVDGNDRYELAIISAEETRTLTLGPSGKPPGLARYVEPVDPPVHGAKTLRLRPIDGDRAYSMGHLLTR